MHLGVVKYSTRRKPRKKRTNNSKNLKTVDTPKVYIEQRPEIVSKKIEFGHWEIDTVYDGDKKGGLLTLNEIKTCKYYTLKIADRRAFTVMTKLIELINKIGKEKFKSITSDNGNEFAYFNRINNLFKIPWYFCHPYSSWERGQNEHLNGEMRFYFPKGTLFHNKSEETIYQKCDRINNKPRRIHGGLSSNDLFNL